MNLISTGEVISIHEDMIHAHGGSGGVLSYGAVDSAVSSAMHGYYDGLSCFGSSIQNLFLRRYLLNYQPCVNR